MQAIKVSDFIKTALKRILQNSASPSINANQLNDGLGELNLIMDSFNADGRMCYTMVTNIFPLQGGQQTYQFGPGGDFDVPARPTYIEFAAYELLSTYPVVDVPISILSADEWESIRVKQIDSVVSFYLYMDEQFPLANVNLFPLPSQGANLRLTYWNALNSSLTLNDTILLPPAYARVISYDLSIALAPFFDEAGSAGVIQLSGVVAKLKKDIGWLNLRGSRLQYSGEAQGSRASGAYDIFTDHIY
jgi:hypothetical protein